MFGWGLGGGLCNPCGFGGLNANQNVNINNNNNTNNNANANNANNTMGSSNMLGGLMNNFGSMFPGCMPMGGCGIPGFGGGGCCGTPTAFPSMPPMMPNCGGGGCCCDAEACDDPCRRGFCVRNFRIISPDGRECSFPVAMPWWACGPTGGVAPAAGSAAAEPAVPDIVDVSAAPAPMPAPMHMPMEESPRRAAGSCTTASQLLMQRYKLEEPPRAYETARYYEPPQDAPVPRPPCAAPEYMQQPQRVYREAPEHAGFS
ncbi:MAG: hypothetical protein FWE40_07575 [Oscillospiraceae bacterium]|nr:hypothetical protein [Oscillospiraceae bacterium]